ncbi:MAG: N-acetylmuramic acid 6-phosphate etherase [Bacteroidota bacterium]
MINITESESNYKALEEMSTHELLWAMNTEDQTVPHAVAGAIPHLEKLAEAVYEKMKSGGRLFYIGAGTSGRLGIVDASECPPTFGVAQGRVVGIIAGGDSAIRKAVEFAEDNKEQAWEDLKAYNISDADVVVGIAASGRTPYVIGGLESCNAAGILTGCIVCNPGSAIEAVAKLPVVAVVGPEFVTGSTRMKAGTAQKLLLNMLTTSVMIKLGHVRGNRMVDMQLSNKKLEERGAKMVMEQTGLSAEESERLLLKFGSVRKAVDAFNERGMATD